MSVSQIKSSKRGTAAHGAIRGSDSGRATPGIPGTVSPGISLACAPDDLVSKIVVAGGGTRFQKRAVAQDDRSMTKIGSRSDVDAGTAQSKSVEVVFYKEILDHFGFPHQCELMRVSTIQPTRGKPQYATRFNSSNR
jgi:hypothetical protein